jgi:hypothetical protein
MKRLWFVFLGIIFLMGGCSTPQTRIEDQPDIYASLSASQKAAVREGRVIEGMSSNAVYLALGEPNRVYHGRKRGKNLDQWIYTRLQPVTTRISPWRSTWHPYWWSGDYDVYEPVYVERPSFIVTFENNKVVAWEELR